MAYFLIRTIALEKENRFFKPEVRIFSIGIAVIVEATLTPRASASVSVQMTVSGSQERDAVGAEFRDFSKSFINSIRWRSFTGDVSNPNFL